MQAASALDAESEHLVQAAIDASLAQTRRTVIIIAHRLSTVKTADRILVVRGGRVIEEGTHDALLVARGTYWQLVQRQLHPVHSPAASDISDTESRRSLPPLLLEDLRE